MFWLETVLNLDTGTTGRHNKKSDCYVEFISMIGWQPRSTASIQLRPSEGPGVCLRPGALSMFSHSWWFCSCVTRVAHVGGAAPKHRKTDRANIRNDIPKRNAQGLEWLLVNMGLDQNHPKSTKRSALLLESTLVQFSSDMRSWRQNGWFVLWNPRTMLKMTHH